MNVLTDRNRDVETARDIFDRVEEKHRRGHLDWMRKVSRFEDMYNGGGDQWDRMVRAYLESREGGFRPCHEVNLIKPTINAIVGYQIANRVDLSYVPRGDSDEKTARLVSKVARQMLDNTSWRHKETMCFLDGIILQRGFIDLRMDYDANDLGEFGIRVIDPMDALIDPDANDRDPDTWADFDETRWLTQAQIESSYGADAARQIVESAREQFADEEKWGHEDGVDRASFAEQRGVMAGYGSHYFGRQGQWRRYRIVHRQVNEYVNTLVARWPTGDVRSVEGRPREYLAWLLDQGIPVFKRRMRTTREMVAGPDTLIVDRVSPYNHITAIPYFPYFRRGRTTGDVDDLVSVQEMLNKFISQYAHVVNSSANGGWQWEEGQLVSPHPHEFAEQAAQSGLHIIRKQGSKPLQKIEPNPVPQGLVQMIEFAYRNFQLISGMDETTLGLFQSKDMSGVAVQSLMFAAQMKKAIVHDSMGITRKLVGERALEYMQKFMGSERILRIAEDDAFGIKRHIPYVLNQRMDDGTVMNDLTIGSYDLVLSEQPATVTYDNSQFEQMKTMKAELGVPIDPADIVRASNLSNKSEIAEKLQQQTGEPNPEAEAEAGLKAALTDKAKAEAERIRADAERLRAEGVNKGVEATFSAVKTAVEIVNVPQVADLADQLLKSNGFIDRDLPPIVPNVPEGMAVSPEAIGPENTHPLAPPNPQRGLDAGLTSTSDFDPTEPEPEPA